MANEDTDFEAEEDSDEDFATFEDFFGRSPELPVVLFLFLRLHHCDMGVNLGLAAKALGVPRALCSFMQQGPSAARSASLPLIDVVSFAECLPFRGRGRINNVKLKLD